MKISGKHTVEAINGIRCVVVERDASEDRANFLSDVLRHNGYDVQIQKNIPPPSKIQKPEEPVAIPTVVIPETFKIGVTDLSFVLSVMLFTRKLKTLENKVLLPSYWSQEDVDYSGWYWKYGNA